MITLFLDNWQTYLTGFGNTILASIIALVFSLIIGSAFAIMELLPSRLLRVIAHIYIEVFRNIPLLVVAMFFYIVVPQYVVKLDGFTAGTIGLTVRAGILAVDPGQMEGARANGLTYWQAMRYIVLPQAYKIVIPPLGNQFINLIKNSSVLAFLAGFDLMYQAQTVASATFKTFSAYFIVGFFYLVLTLPLSYYMRYLEKKLA